MPSAVRRATAARPVFTAAAACAVGASLTPVAHEGSVGERQLRSSRQSLLVVADAENDARQPDFDAVYRCVVESQQCARTVGKEAGADVQTIEFWEEAGQVMLVLIQHTNNAAQAV